MGGKGRQLKIEKKQAIWWIHQFNCVCEDDSLHRGDRGQADGAAQLLDVGR